MSNENATFTTTCFGAADQNQTPGVNGTIAAKTTKQINTSAAKCPAGTNALEFTLSVPEGSVVGSFVRQNVSTGDLNSDGVVGNANGQKTSNDD